MKEGRNQPPYCTSITLLHLFSLSSLIRVARVVAPKKAKLKEANADLAVAMEVRR